MTNNSDLPNLAACVERCETGSNVMQYPPPPFVGDLGQVKILHLGPLATTRRHRCGEAMELLEQFLLPSCPLDSDDRQSAQLETVFSQVLLPSTLETR